MNDERKCKNCMYFVQHDYQHAHVGNCEIRLPVWVARDNEGNGRAVVKSDACDLFQRALKESTP